VCRDRHHRRDALQSQERKLTRLPAVLAVTWVGAVAVIWAVGPELTPAEVGARPESVGDVWRLLSSSLIVDAGFPLLQILALCATTALVLVRHGGVVWWLAALAGHVGSALLAYALIAVADALGSDSAERVQDDWDYGISCVLAALAGVLFAGGLRRLRGGSGGPADIALVAVASLGLVGWIVTIDWYGVEHVLAFGLGAGVLASTGDRLRTTGRAGRECPADPR
jgi:hypothetical protein